jgi:hypothetical protein
VRRGRPIARCGVAGAAALALAAAGCGGESKRQDADERVGIYTLEIVRASFPSTQRLADKSRFQITVRNADNKTLPNVAVTIESGSGAAPGAGGGGGSGAPAAAFAYAESQPGLADPSRPIWIVDSGPVGGTTAYTNTWALGPLRPGEEKTFIWNVTAVKAGQHTVRYKVAAGLTGKAKTQLAGGQAPEGSFTVDISGAPANTRVDDSGRVVPAPGPASGSQGGPSSRTGP